MKKFIFAVLLILLVGLFALHFVAADRAEEAIDKAIQEQVSSSTGNISVQYSGIDVSPFSGDIFFRDVTLVEKSNIERTRELNVDLGYFDFLRLSINGVESGLKNLSGGDMQLSRTTFVNRETLQEFSIDTLHINYSGNMWDALQSLFTEQATEYSHTITFSGNRGSYKKPNSSVGNFSADSVFFRFDLPKGTDGWRKDGAHRMMFKRVKWTPPTSFQNKYGFFIQGFGYQLDAIPMDSLGVIYSMPDPSRLDLTEGVAATDLFNARFHGTIQNDSTWSDAVFAPLEISLVNLSDQFTNVLANVEQLVGITVPGKQDDEIHFQLIGPVQNPRMSTQTSSSQ